MSNTTVEISSPKRPNPFILKNPTTPDKPIDPETIQNAVLKSPDQSHHANLLGNWIHNKNQKIRRLEAKLPAKNRHTVLFKESPKKDIWQIKKGLYKPDRYGVIRVPTSSGEERKWKIHDVNNSSGANRIIPVKGRGLAPFTGPELKEVISYYRKSNQEKPLSFSDYLEKNVSVAQTPQKMRIEVGKEEPSSSSTMRLKPIRRGYKYKNFSGSLFGTFSQKPLRAPRGLNK